MENHFVQNHVAAGEILAGKYRVERTLGMGGMGLVVAATHLDLREERAIKLIRPDLNHPQIVERFLREARAVVKLRSEHVAQVYDIGRLPSGAPFIVMELLKGEDLAALLKRRGTLPVEEAVQYVMQACDAVAEAHSRGIVHRDLKPANLFLTHREDGSPCIKVLDFGVSKHVQPDGECTELEMTNNGDIMGSPLYMAPEQMRAAREVDARADLWALGAILYKLLTGRAPFQRATTPEIFMAVLGSEVAPLPSSSRSGVPSGLDAVVHRCLQKNIESRFSRAVDLKAALSPYSERREGWPDEERLSQVDEPRSSRVSNSSRPIPKNIDAILLGCIGKDNPRRAARAGGRRTASDPFLRKVSEQEQKSTAAPPVTPLPAAPSPAEPSSPGNITAPVGGDELGGLRLMASGRSQSTPPAAPVDEATALLPPRLPSFSSFPPPPNDKPTHPSAMNLAFGEGGNSVAPWDYAPSAPAPSRKRKPLAVFASATTAAFIIVALVMAFTQGGNSDDTAAASVRPAAGGMPTPIDTAVPTASASAAPATAQK